MTMTLGILLTIMHTILIYFISFEDFYFNFMMITIFVAIMIVLIIMVIVNVINIWININYFVFAFFPARKKQKFNELT